MTRADQPSFVRELAHGLCVGYFAGDAEALVARLPELERGLAAQVAPRARAQFAAGRLALREALRQLGVAPCAVGRTPRGGPQLPPGVAGSVSHKPGLAVALATLVDDEEIGVDLEELRPRRTGLARHVLCETERGQVAALPASDAALDVVVRFSIKEAVAKALDPFLGRQVDFQEIDAGDIPTNGKGRVGLRLRHASPLIAEATCEIHDELTPIGPAVLSTARVQRGS